MPATISNKTGIRNAKLFPDEDPENDRILNQMMFVPPTYDPSRRMEIMKTIYVPLGLPSWWKLKNGDSAFANCPVDACRITADAKERKNADLIMFNHVYVHSNETRPPKQLYAMYYTEPPMFTTHLIYPGKTFSTVKSFFLFNFNCITILKIDIINWTISYR